ncbi:YlqD family protein [Selenomonas artemidis]|mgnify:FL=1|uniref:YlqD family protein n=1 Tax=Selenomonas artemidis TaxID=671224 RepID=UPI00258A08F6|nr:YlqD family protein [Selenomonas artemidis]
MDSISLKVPVTVKAKLTEKLRTKMRKEMEEGVSRAELELQQIGIQEKRVMQEAEQGELTPQAIDHINMIRQERQSRMEYVEQTRAHLEELEKFAEGAEIIQGTLEHQVEVHVGDDMREIMNVEILVEDDKIIAIRS